MKLASLLLSFVLALMALGCASSSGEGGSRSLTKENVVAFTKNVPGEGAFVMYANLASADVLTLAYLSGATTGPSVDNGLAKSTALRPEDFATFQRVFASGRLETYRADDWKGEGAARTTCPDVERVCGPGQSGADCLCAAPPGSVSALQYDVVWNGVPGSPNGMFTFREPMGETTRELVVELEAIRQFHFGR
jgi:hypothetical protein